MGEFFCIFLPNYQNTFKNYDNFKINNSLNIAMKLQYRKSLLLMFQKFQYKNYQN